MRSGGWVLIPDAQKQDSRASHVCRLICVRQKWLCRRGVFSARSLVQRLMCHRKWQCRDFFYRLSPSSVQQSPFKAASVSPATACACLAARRRDLTCKVLHGCSIAGLKAQRQQFLALEDFFTCSFKIFPSTLNICSQ